MEESIIELLVPFEDMFSEAHKEAIANSIKEYPNVKTLRTLLVVESHNLKEQRKKEGSKGSCVVVLTTSLMGKDTGEDRFFNPTLVASIVMKRTYESFKGIVQLH